MDPLFQVSDIPSRINKKRLADRIKCVGSNDSPFMDPQKAKQIKLIQMILYKLIWLIQINNDVKIY